MKRQNGNISIHRGTAYKAICLVFALILLFALLINECMLLWRYENLRDADKTIDRYIYEQSAVLASRNMLKSLPGINDGSTAAAVSMCINSTDKALISEAFPLITQYGFVASFVIHDDAIPGTGDCISDVDYNTLTDAGWMVVIAGDGGIDLSVPGAAKEYSAYLDDYADMLSEHSITFPHIFLLEAPNPADEYLDVLKNHGICMILQGFSPNRQKQRNIGFWSHGIYFCGTVSIQTGDSDVQQTIYDAGAERGSMTVITRNITSSPNADPALDCSVSKYVQCLDWFKNDAALYSFRITSLDDMFEENESYYNVYQEYFSDAGTPEELREQIDKELSDLSDELYGYMSSLYEPLTHRFDFETLKDFVSSHGIRGLIQLHKEYRNTVKMHKKAGR